MAMKIAVYCSSSENLSPELYEKGEEFGRLLAEGGNTLVYGGYDKGIMGAVAQGVNSVGGQIISVIPEIFRDEKKFGVAASTRIIYTKTMHQRKAAMEQECDAIAILPGGIGTMDEFFEALVLSALGELKRPIAVYSLCRSQQILKELLAVFVQEKMMWENVWNYVEFVDSPEKMLEYFQEKLNRS